jgi:integrase
MDTTYDVRVWGIKVYQGKRRKTYYVRWRVETHTFNEPFTTRALADSFRSDLISATKRGEPFDLATGRPASTVRVDTDITWFTFAADYAAIKWPAASPEHRRGIAEALTNTTMALLATERGKPGGKILRRACKVTFSLNLRRAEPDDETASAVRWLERNTAPVSELAKPDVLRAVVNATGSKLDGTPAATSTTRRKRMTLRNALDFAVERNLLKTNPLVEVKQSAKMKAPGLRQVDRRSVVNPVQARTLLDAVADQKPSGPRMVAFFGLMYYAGLRPEEAAALTKACMSLPPAGWNDETRAWEFAEDEDGWGELHLESARPEVSADWTDGQTASEERGLKHRDRNEGRTVPSTPELTLLLIAHLDKFGTAPDGRLFLGVRNQARIGSSVYGRSWAAARSVVFTPDVVASTLAKRPYDLRHAAVSTWIKAGVEVTRVAEWAGHSVAVLLRVYAKFIDGGEQTARSRVADVLRG